jgi:hypothetical protein
VIDFGIFIRYYYNEDGFFVKYAENRKEEASTDGHQF